eukprot:CAMPEP_0185478604 /NCGR_PEP_ID=MMETSP1366-20130426/4898_1 /TAXON_ID=38817 /ORGANISM="Gephyrocapsa oceanica, Strain RCC1303" /LENGTH=390 /DNA_ID=CAMNT_0028085895 /DNA_START=23 /DNA_END=1194 /DNA_ORIENTATION=-
MRPIAALPVACLVVPWPSAPPHAPRAAAPRAAIVSGSTQYGYVEQAYLQQQGYEDGRGHQGYAQIAWSLTGPTGGQYFVEAGGQQKLGRYDTASQKATVSRLQCVVRADQHGGATVVSVGKPLTGWRAAPGTPWQWLRGENFGDERALFEGATTLLKHLRDTSETTSRLHLGYLSATSRLPLNYISAISRLYLAGAQLSLDQSDPEREVFTVRKEGGAADEQQQQQQQQHRQRQMQQNQQNQQHHQMQQHHQHHQHHHQHQHHHHHHHHQHQHQHQPGYEQPQDYATAAPATAAPYEAYEAQAAPFDAQQGGGYAPLPAGWCGAVDEASGQTYYYHEQTGASQWEPPQAEHGYGGYSVDLRGGVPLPLTPAARHKLNMLCDCRVKNDRDT